MLRKLLWLAGAGTLGTVSRYALSGLVQRWTGAAFPWGTLAVNVVGCFAAGFLWTLAEARLALSATARTAALIGFLGAFTTFSAFMLETGQLLRDAQWLRASLNILLQNGIGLVALLAGFAVARRI